MKPEMQSFRTEKEAAEIITRFEKKHQLFSHAVNGVSVWQILRFSVASDLQNLPLKNSPIPRAALIRHSLLGMIHLFKRLVSCKKYDYWVSTGVSALRFRQGEFFWDIYFDLLISKVPRGLKIQVLNASGYEFQQSHAFRKPDIDITVSNLIVRVLARLLPVKNDLGVFNSISKLIEKDLGLRGYSENVIRRVFSFIWWQARLYELLLWRLKPKVVIVADTGEFALLLACRRCGVKCIELQHGIQTPDHPSTLPEDALAHESNLLLPSFWGVFGDYWKERLSGTIMALKGKIRSVGTDMIDTYREYRILHFSANPLHPVITLTTQGLDTENLIEFIREFLVISDVEFCLNVKLHPAYDNSTKSYVDALGNDERCKIISGKENPNTYELIANSDLHLSIASACHYDALGLGVPTVVIGLAGHQLMDDLVVRGDASIAMTPQDLAEIVQGCQFGTASNETSEKYFKQGFVRNVSELAGIGEYA
jgi:hypothetical protein